MSGTNSIEVVGQIAPAWAEDIERFVEGLTEHAWGGSTADRVVVSNDVPAALEEWMTPDEWAAESPRLAGAVGDAQPLGGKALLARDGRWTVIVRAEEERERFLMLVGHEMVEAAIEKRQKAAGEEWGEATVGGFAHLLWTEYVVERTRTDVAAKLGMSASSAALSRPLLRLASHTKREAKNAGAITQQAWVNLMLEWARTTGRIDGGDVGEAGDLEAFYRNGMIASAAAQWHVLVESLRAVFEAGTSVPSPALDGLVAPAATEVLMMRPTPPAT